MVNDGSSHESGGKITPPKLVPAPAPNGVPEHAKTPTWQNGEWVTLDSPTQPIAAVNPKADPKRQYDPTFQDTMPMSLLDLAKGINEEEAKRGKLHEVSNEDTRPIPAIKPQEQKVVPIGDRTNPSGK